MGARFEEMQSAPDDSSRGASVGVGSEPDLNGANRKIQTSLPTSLIDLAAYQPARVKM